MSAKNVLMAAAGAGGGAPSDPNFKQTALLLHGDGNQGANNLYNPGPTKYLAFSDNSNNNFPITVNGDAYGTNFSPYQGSYSNVFEASSGITVPAQQFPGDFTWELWYYPTALGSGTDPNYSVVIGCGDIAIQNIQLYVDLDGSVRYYNGSTGLINSAANLVVVNQWAHIALVRSGSTTTLYVNGVSRGSGTDTGTKNILSIGCFLPFNAKYNVRGRLSNVRTTTTAVYTSAFTPPTAPLTAISGTSLLLCQANRFADNSASPKTVTVTGNVTVSSLQPFTLAANDNGSGYFDGTGDYLSVANNAAFQFGTGDFTVEFWVYANSSSATHGLVAASLTGSGYWASLIFSGLIYWQSQNGTTNLLSTSYSGYYNIWTHVAFVRNSGTTKLYLNGIERASASDSTNYNGSSGNYDIGRDQDNTALLTGYLSNVRIVKGTGVYTSNFTPPTAPVANITNTSLLTCQYSGSVRNVGFIDSSPNYFPITRVGNTTQGTFSPFSVGAGQWSNYFDGVSENLSVANNAAFQFGTGDFTVEAWVYILAYTDYGVIVKCATDSSWSAGWALSLGSVAGGLIEFYVNGNAVSQASRPPLNSWSHVAVSRSGTSLRIFINGALIQTVTNSGSLVQTTALTIGADITNTNFEFNGYISNVRVVKGTAVYTSAFTPPTTPLTAITNTSLLTCQSNRFVDNSTNNFTITRNGDVRVTPFSPFAPTAAYDPAVNGGSASFDGTGDYLRRGTAGDPAFNFGPGNFTIEMFVYHNQLKNYSGLIGEVPGTTNNTINFYTFADGTVGATLLSVNQQMASAAGVAVAGAWQHFALVRNGNVTTLYVDGISRATYSSSANMGVGQSAGFAIGSTHGTGDLNGYVSNVRILKGVAQYTANFTPPTAPLTAITNTSLLCNFTNAGIFDQTGKNVLETVGNAQVDTNVKKFGTGSMKFDGTGDYLLAYTNANPALNFGSNNFTIEMFVYHNQLKNYSGLIGDPNTIALYTYTSGAVGVNLLTGSGQVMASSTGVALANTWQHYAIVRNGTITTLYVDGTSRATYISSGGMQLGQTNGFRVGSVNTWGDLNGYIDDLRITKGVARYTANFTPPALAFPDK